MKTYTATCEDCGYTTTSKTEKLAAKGLRMHSCDKARHKAAAHARRLARSAAVDRTPKPCHHKQTEHVHGTHACYVLDRCRCTDCSAANTPAPDCSDTSRSAELPPITTATRPNARGSVTRLMP